MPLLMNIALIVIFVLIAALHYMAIFTEKYEKALLFVNISLHILMLLPLLYFEASMEVLVMIYFASITLRSLLSFVSYKRRDRE